MYNQYPHTDFHALNLNWILEQVMKAIQTVEGNSETIKKLIADQEALREFVTTYFDNLDLDAEVSEKLDQMVEDGTLAQLIASITSARVNVAAFVTAPLTGENLQEAINNALQVSTALYIPAGEYKTRVVLDDVTCDILADERAIFTHLDVESTPEIFRFNNCSVRMRGGEFRGDFYPEKRSLFAGHNHGLMELHNCAYNHLSNIKAHDSKHGSVIHLENSKNTVIDRCEFSDFLLSAIHILYTCDDTIVENCTFKNAYIPTGLYYCYFVYTGVRSVSETGVSTPPTGITYSGNYGDGSEDCGLDTHGAQNVWICNNHILNTATAITAYNDGRVQRPTGWIMRNVTIENNVCESSAVNPDHGIAYIFLSNDYRHAIRYENYIVRNNTFHNESVSIDLIALVCIKDLVVENNLFHSGKNARYVIWVLHCQNVAFNNNVLIGGTEANVRFDHCNGMLHDITGDLPRVYYEDVANYNYMRGSHTYATDYVPRMMTYGDTYHYSNRDKLVTSYGVRTRENAYSIDPLDGTVTGRTVETGGTVRFVSGQKILIGSYAAMVADVIDANHFTFVTSDDITDGQYSCTARECTTQDITPANQCIDVDKNVDAATYKEPGAYCCFGKMAGTPVPDETELTELHVYNLRGSIIRQIVRGVSSGATWVRVVAGSSAGSWFKYTGTGS